MIWSKYSYLFQEGDRFYLYNSLSNSFAELDRDSYTLLCKQSEKKNDINISDEGLKEILMKMKVIVDNDHDAFLRFKYRTLLRSVCQYAFIPNNKSNLRLQLCLSILL